MQSPPDRRYPPFLEWSPPNLQSNLMLYPTRSGPIESGQYDPNAADHGVPERPQDDLATFGEADFSALMEMLDEVRRQHACGLHACGLYP